MLIFERTTNFPSNIWSSEFRDFAKFLPLLLTLFGGQNRFGKSRDFESESTLHTSRTTRGNKWNKTNSRRLLDSRMTMSPCCRVEHRHWRISRALLELNAKLQKQRSTRVESTNMLKLRASTKFRHQDINTSSLEPSMRPTFTNKFPRSLSDCIKFTKITERWFTSKYIPINSFLLISFHF